MELLWVPGGGREGGTERGVKRGNQREKEGEQMKERGWRKLKERGWMQHENRRKKKKRCEMKWGREGVTEWWPAVAKRKSAVLLFTPVWRITWWGGNYDAGYSSNSKHACLKEEWMGLQRERRKWEDERECGRTKCTPTFRHLTRWIPVNILVDLSEYAGLWFTHFFCSNTVLVRPCRKEIFADMRYQRTSVLFTRFSVMVESFRVFEDWVAML